jgi:diguanylate cyclase (GGDEF)-like protein
VIGYLVVLHSITEHKRLLQATRKLAEEDALTGVLNRTRFVELTNQEIEHANASSLDFMILMIDIDKFKEINDTAGHVCGDQVIQTFARRLQSLLRSSDLIGRIGGDEFIVLLPETSEEKGWQLASRLCVQVAASPMETTAYGAFPITISIGVAQGMAGSHETLEQVIIRADQALYQAKEQGRNRVCIGK